jgi:hypothetical protein
MRLSAFVFAAYALTWPAIAAAQGYSGTTSTTPSSISTRTSSVIRPAAAQGWRNYVTVPDGPCGHPMAVETDCYNVCHPCGPLRPICFLRRVGRMLDCLLPCNLCCRGGGGCGLFHGCNLGGRHWGHCGVCCGGGAMGGCGGGKECGGGGCCPNPCGSAFASVPCGGEGHSYGCSSVLPGLANPFIDDPLPPKPTAQPATEVRRAPAKKPESYVAQAKAIAPVQAAAPVRPVAPPRAFAAVPKRTSPYKIITDPTTPAYSAWLGIRHGSANVSSADSQNRNATAEPSVLRRASAEEEGVEPARFEADYSEAEPIIRSQTPDDAGESAIPHNPLRN